MDDVMNWNKSANNLGKKHDMIKKFLPIKQKLSQVHSETVKLKTLFVTYLVFSLLFSSVLNSAIGKEHSKMSVSDVCLTFRHNRDIYSWTS